MNLHPIRIQGMGFVLLDQLDIMIPYGHMLVALMAADAVWFKAQDMNRVLPEWDYTKKTKTVGGCAADFPGGAILSNWFKRRERLCDRLECFQLLKFSKYCFF